MGSASDVDIMRSSQLDAARLDDELTSMLREQFLSAFALFRPAVVARLQPELTLLLELLVGAGLQGDHASSRPALGYGLRGLPGAHLTCMPSVSRPSCRPCPATAVPAADTACC